MKISELKGKLKSNATITWWKKETIKIEDINGRGFSDGFMHYYWDELEKEIKENKIKIESFENPPDVCKVCGQKIKESK